MSISKLALCLTGFTVCFLGACKPQADSEAVTSPLPREETGSTVKSADLISFFESSEYPIPQERLLKDDVRNFLLAGLRDGGDLQAFPFGIEEIHGKSLVVYSTPLGEETAYLLLNTQLMYGEFYRSIEDEIKLPKVFIEKAVVESVQQN